MSINERYGCRETDIEREGNSVREKGNARERCRESGIEREGNSVREKEVFLREAMRDRDAKRQEVREKDAVS